MTGSGRAYYRSPIGTIEILANEEGVTALNFVSGEPAAFPRQHPILRAAVVEVDEYFRGKRSEFSVPLILRGTDFQIDIWRRLVRIPYGQTATYSDLARAVGRPRAMRAVGQANHRNPISIVIPCHRVVGSDGRLVGYGGGLWRKGWLLEHEKKHSARLPGPR
ncbi:MAG: cysteine methyltransferase [Candidatus Aminicenantes bacterium RBG_13_59_9]|jgi:methylated-DNA-[protein]-cysteine S-methyltransferase|nr:MAG: cysteine methyltransferase [Candidatus Aminicenantes bacterium RBG_13_59_9]